MKKLLITILSLAIIAVGATSVFAANSATAPKEPLEIASTNTSSPTVTTTSNGNDANPLTSVSQTDLKENEDTTSNGNRACINNGVCQNAENCPNNGIPKRDGTGNKKAGQGRNQGRGNNK